ncbi:hypothetical protein SASPL_137982 [Salvia splendens]|uniref:Uncharacterized protein n=1 Tax=Salvia splendens TaxID=180675 RepID=A0A8X8WUG4_SALSN|nr:hypothetical protein SASPL_137982 [Salvia splendens]
MSGTGPDQVHLVCRFRAHCLPLALTWIPNETTQVFFLEEYTYCSTDERMKGFVHACKNHFFEEGKEFFLPVDTNGDNEQLLLVRSLLANVETICTSSKVSELVEERKPEQPYFSRSLKDAVSSLGGRFLLTGRTSLSAQSDVVVKTTTACEVIDVKREEECLLDMEDVSNQGAYDGSKLAALDMSSSWLGSLNTIPWMTRLTDPHDSFLSQTGNNG